jgi:hypothetical protein
LDNAADLPLGSYLTDDATDDQKRKEKCQDRLLAPREDRPTLFIGFGHARSEKKFRGN